MKNDAIHPLCPEREFFGRQREIDYICNRATEPQKLLPGMFLAGKRWVGKTEVLRRVYQWLFWNQAAIAPIYYQFRSGTLTEHFADDYIIETVKQCLAFIKRDAQGIKANPSLNELEKMLMEMYLSGITELILNYKEAKSDGDYTAALKNAVRAPYVLSHQWNIPVFLMLDDTNRIAGKGHSKEWSAIVEECSNLLRHGSFSFLMAGATRRILPGEALSGAVEVLELAGLEEEPAVSMMVELCRHNNTPYDTEILAIAARKLEGNPMYLKSVVWSASKMGRSLSSLKDFADVYTHTLIDGNLGFSLNAAVSLETLHDLKVLNVYAYTDHEHSVEEVSTRLKCDIDVVKRTVDRQISFGLLEKNLGTVVWTGGNVIKDFVGYVYGTRVSGKTPEEIKTQIVSKELKEGFSVKGEKVEGKIKAEIIDVLTAFSGQMAPAALFLNPIHTSHSKNSLYQPGSDEKENNVIQLPQVVGCFGSARWEKNESGMPIIIAHGFQNGRYDAAHEVFWMVGIKESTSPVTTDEATDFIRRSSLLQRHFEPTSPVRWIVGTEGFANDALLHRLAGEGVYTTDTEQLGKLKNFLERGDTIVPNTCMSGTSSNKEFDVVLPMSPRAELVAARAAEEIGAGMGFDDDDVSRIKAALVEACINAFEHCKIKGSRVYLRFVVGNDRLVVQVQNKGALFDRMPAPGSLTEPISGLPHKRGWGMELMKGLMDEVRLETLSSGARIVMVKYLPGKGKKGNEQPTQKL